MDLYEYSVVHFLRDHTGGRCGYCGATDTNYSRGMWAYRLTCHDYELLIDRGLRRSGKYVYKPSMDITCCPCYSVKCEALEFRVSKAQKKLMNRVLRYLKTGEKRPSKPKVAPESSKTDEPSSSWMDVEDDKKDVEDDKKDQKELEDKQEEEETPEVVEGQTKGSTEAEASEEKKGKGKGKSLLKAIKSAKKQATIPRSGEGGDPNKPPCKKAKQIRKERKLAKLLAKQTETGTEGNTEVKEEEKTEEQIKKEKTEKEDMSEGTSVDHPPPPPAPSPTPPPSGKTLQDYVDEHKAQGSKGKHTLEVTLVRSQPRRFEFNDAFDESYALYKKYQMAIHKDKPHQCSVAQFTRFLVESPIQEEYKSGFPRHGFGSFHQHYRLDGKLIAVAVLDILPHSVSSVYLYYDPDFEFLSLGNYSALREIAFTEELHKTWANISRYYMGFYIHNCVKMKYKGHFHPSYLLCPLAYTWQPIEKCFLKLDINSYSRLDDSDKEDEPINLKKVLIFFERMIMQYHVYQMASQMGDYHTEDVTNYANTIGKDCSEKLLLIFR